jgi:acyl-CoA hydrolase
MSQLMLPSDANSSGNVHGGTILKLVDSAAGVVAMRHCRRRVVTARLDEMSFLRPVYIGNLVTLKAAVNDTGRTSLEVGVRVEAEDLTGGETWHVGSAYLVFVALDASGQPAPVPALLAEGPEEVRRQDEARRRRARRART